MSTRFTIAQLNELVSQGKIKGYTQNQPQNIPQKPVKNIPDNKQDAGAGNKQWLHDALKAWCEEERYLLIREHTFSEARDWRLDWAVFSFNGINYEKVVAVEYEGIFSKKSRHTTVKGFTEDSDKYRAAALEGWKVLRYTAKNYEELLTDLDKLKNQNHPGPAL